MGRCGELEGLYGVVLGLGGGWLVVIFLFFILESGLVVGIECWDCRGRVEMVVIFLVLGLWWGLDFVGWDSCRGCVGIEIMVLIWILLEGVEEGFGGSWLLYLFGIFFGIVEEGFRGGCCLCFGKEDRGMGWLGWDEWILRWVSWEVFLWVLFFNLMIKGFFFSGEWIIGDECEVCVCNRFDWVSLFIFVGFLVLNIFVR